MDLFLSSEWLTAVQPRLRGTTASSYRIAVDRIKVALGAVRLGDLTCGPIGHVVGWCWLAHDLGDGPDAGTRSPVGSNGEHLL